MALIKQPREQLKSRFREKNVTGDSYMALIDSMINSHDDGIEKDSQDGLRLTTSGSSKKLLTFVDSAIKSTLRWNISINPSQRESGLSFSVENNPESILFLHEQGRVGVGTSQPQQKLDVRGVVAMEGRMGGLVGKVDADGTFQTILKDVEPGSAFEVIAQVHDDMDERYALTYAILLVTRGKDGGKAHYIEDRASSKWFWGKSMNDIIFHFEPVKGGAGREEKYLLQVKTRSHFDIGRDGKPKKILFRITKLWDRSFGDVEFAPSSPSAIGTLNSNSGSGMNRDRQPLFNNNSSPNLGGEKKGSGGGFNIKPR